MKKFHFFRKHRRQKRHLKKQKKAAKIAVKEQEKHQEQEEEEAESPTTLTSTESSSLLLSKTEEMLKSLVVSTCSSTAANQKNTYTSSAILGSSRLFPTISMATNRNHDDDDDDEEKQNYSHDDEEEFEVLVMEDLTVDKFLTSFRENGSECISSAYLTDRDVRQSSSGTGTLSTSLPEDVFTLVDVQTTVLHDYITKSKHIMGMLDIADAVLIDGLLSITRTLWHKQTHYRDNLMISCKSLESCIAAANDFLRMIDKVDELLLNMSTKYPRLMLLKGATDDSSPKYHNGSSSETWTASCVLKKEIADLVSLYGSDSVYAARKASNFILHDIQKGNLKVQQQLFSRDWEDRLVHNEVAVSMVRVFEDYLSDIHNYLEHEFLYHKLVAALVRSTVCFYVKCLINKADQVRSAGKRKIGGSPFGGKSAANQAGFMSASRAIRRMTYDIEVLRDYFRCVVSKESEALNRVVLDEFSMLAIILECMWLAVDQTGADSLEEFIVVVHKRTGADSDVTKQFLSDLWILMAPSDRHNVIAKTVNMMKSELQMVSSRMKETADVSSWKTNQINSSNYSSSSSGLDEMLKTMYTERNIQKQASLCGNIFRDVAEFRRCVVSGGGREGVK